MQHDSNEINTTSLCTIRIDNGGYCKFDLHQTYAIYTLYNDVKNTSIAVSMPLVFLTRWHHERKLKQCTSRDRS